MKTINLNDNSFPAKILLFGEYTILLGSSALGIPYPAFNAVLRFPDDAEPSSARKQVTSNHHLLEFYEYLTGQGEQFLKTIDFKRFQQDLAHGLFLQSNIPAGYGLGSSGALVAAVYNRFSSYPSPQHEKATDERMLRLKTIFSEMESFFHGKSSGFDPTVSFLKRPLLLRSDGVLEFKSLPDSFSSGGSGIFLLNTGRTAKTAPLVKQFIDKFKPEGKISEEGKALVSLIDHLVFSYLDFSDQEFWELMKRFSLMQVGEFKPMIPENFTFLWMDGAENDLFYLKLCGSGGGGNLMGFAPDLKKATDFLQDHGYYPVVVPVQ